MVFAKAELSAGMPIPAEGTVVVTVNDQDKPTVTPIIRRFHDLGWRVLATGGTARYLRARGIPVDPVFKVGEGRPNIVSAAGFSC
jgi:carbamoyl-phosphate synthase large subunit